jgi:hypothetical protein
VQRKAGIGGKRVEELAEELRIEVADLGPREADVPDKVRAARHVDRRARASLVHREVDGGVAADAAALAQRLPDRLAEGDADILDRVVEIDMRVPGRAHGHVDQRMAGELLQHMIEEADAGGDLVPARAVELDGDGDLGFAGVALDFGCSHGCFRGSGRPCNSEASGNPHGGMGLHRGMHCSARPTPFIRVRAKQAAGARTADLLQVLLEARPFQDSG